MTGRGADGAALASAALAVGVLGPLLYRLPAFHSDPGVFTVGLLLPAVIAYGVHCAVRRSISEPALLAFVFCVAVVWWAGSALLYPAHWLAVDHLAVAVPLAVLGLTGVILGVAGVINRRGRPRRARRVALPRIAFKPPERQRPAYPAAAIDPTKPGPDGFPRQSWERARGLERAETLVLENKRFDLRGPGERMAQLMNRALDEAAAGDHHGAIATLGEAMAEFEGKDTTGGAGYNHNYQLQSGAAIILIRMAASWLVLERPDKALQCYDTAYTRFHSAMEEQAGEEDFAARQWAAEAMLRAADLLDSLGHREQAVAAWRHLLPSDRGFMWASLADWADEAGDRLR